MVSLITKGTRYLISMWVYMSVANRTIIHLRSGKQSLPLSNDNIHEKTSSNAILKLTLIHNGHIESGVDRYKIKQ